jgi:S-adenosyl methyltransferase
VAPVIGMIAPAWRRFTRRVLRYLVRDAGVRQFLFACRIVFADDDPLVLAHARAHMRDGAVGYVPAGLRDPGAIIAEDWRPSSDAAPAPDL